MLIIEDGTGVSGANTYVTDVEYAAYAAARGLTIGSDAPAREIELIQSMDFLFSREKDLQGQRSVNAQENIYPRKNVFIRDIKLDKDAIPIELKNAQMEGGVASNSQKLLINATVQNVSKERLGQLEVEYFSGGSFENIRLDRVINYLKPLLKQRLTGLNRV